MDAVGSSLKSIGIGDLGPLKNVKIVPDQNFNLISVHKLIEDSHFTEITFDHQFVHGLEDSGLRVTIGEIDNGLYVIPQAQFVIPQSQVEVEHKEHESDETGSDNHANIRRKAYTVAFRTKPTHARTLTTRKPAPRKELQPRPEHQSGSSWARNRMISWNRKHGHGLISTLTHSVTLTLASFVACAAHHSARTPSPALAV